MFQSDYSDELAQYESTNWDTNTNHRPSLSPRGSNMGDPDNDIDTMEVFSGFFDRLSDSSGIDHPLCSMCADNTISSLEKLVNSLSTEINQQSAAIENLNKKTIQALPNPVSIRFLLAETETELNRHHFSPFKCSSMVDFIKLEANKKTALNTEEARMRRLINSCQCGIDDQELNSFKYRTVSFLVFH